MMIDGLSRTDGALPSALPLEPWVDLGDPDHPTGLVRGTVRIVDQGDRAVRFGPELFTSAKGGRVAVDPRTGRFTYTPSAAARQVSRTSAHYRDKVDTFAVDVVDVHGTRAAAHVVVDILAADVPLSGATLSVDSAAAHFPGTGYVSTGVAGWGRIDGTPSGDAGLFTFSKGVGGAGDVEAVTVFPNGTFVYTGSLRQAVSFDIVATVGGQSFVIQTVDMRPPTISTSMMTSTSLGDVKTWNGIAVSDTDSVILQKVTQLNGEATVSGPTLGLWSVKYQSRDGGLFFKGSPGNVVVRAVDSFGFYSSTLTLEY